MIPENGKMVPTVITESGPVQLTAQEEKMYQNYAARQKGTLVKSGVDWFKENMTGTQRIHK